MTVAQTVAYPQPETLHTGALAFQNMDQASRALAQSEALCRSRGARLTPIRRRVLETLHASPKPLGAYDIADALAPDGRRVAPITVYRALDFLIEQGLAHRLASQNAYIASQDNAAGRTTAFLICEGCGSVNEVSSPEVADTVMGVLKRQGFQSQAKVLEIMGRCAHCQDVH